MQVLYLQLTNSKFFDFRTRPSDWLFVWLQLPRTFKTTVQPTAYFSRGRFQPKLKPIGKTDCNSKTVSQYLELDRSSQISAKKNKRATVYDSGIRLNLVTISSCISVYSNNGWEIAIAVRRKEIRLSQRTEYLDQFVLIENGFINYKV
jgi:hypothetical protein